MIIAQIKVLLVVLIIAKLSVGANSSWIGYKLTTKAQNSVPMKSIRCLSSKRSVFIIQCTLKPVNRALQYLSLNVTQLKPPLRELKLHFRMLKKANDYQSFGIDVHIDVCQLLDGKKYQIFEWRFSHGCGIPFFKQDAGIVLYGYQSSITLKM